MKQINSDELRTIQISILEAVSEFCESNDIKYWIDNGTLLGAIRHKGYIPWDDDIDIGMLREDYDKFSKLFNSCNNKYRFLCLENTPDFYLSHGKVCDTDTKLYEPDENGIELFVNIDIFVYDNAPDDDSLVKKMYDCRDKLRNRYIIKNEKIINDKKSIKTYLKIIRRFVYKMLYKENNEIFKMIENSKSYASIETRRVGNFTSYTRMACEKSVFRESILVEFEGKMYKAPIGYDEWLKSFYGDYMKLPPEEKRVSHHSFVAYKK